MNQNKEFLDKLNKQFQNNAKNGGRSPFQIWKESCKQVDKHMPDITNLCVFFTTKDGSDYINFNDNGLCELVGMIDLMRNHILGDRFGEDSDN